MTLESCVYHFEESAMSDTSQLPRGDLLPFPPPLATFLGQTMFTHLTLQVASLKIHEQ